MAHASDPTVLVVITQIGTDQRDIHESRRTSCHGNAETCQRGRNLTVDVQPRRRQYAENYASGYLLPRRTTRSTSARARCELKSDFPNTDNEPCFRLSSSTCDRRCGRTPARWSWWWRPCNAAHQGRLCLRGEAGSRRSQLRNVKAGHFTKGGNTLKSTAGLVPGDEVVMTGVDKLQQGIEGHCGQPRRTGPV